MDPGGRVSEDRRRRAIAAQELLPEDLGPAEQLSGVEDSAEVLGVGEEAEAARMRVSRAPLAELRIEEGLVERDRLLRSAWKPASLA